MKRSKKIASERSKNAQSSFLFEELEPRLLLSADLPVDLASDFSPQDESLIQSSLNEFEVRETRAKLTSANGDLVSAVRQELVFVDTDTPAYQQLLDDLLANQDETRRFEVILLDNSSDGIVQITNALSEYHELDAVHIISHASDGNVKVGNNSLGLEALVKNTGSISTWADAFSEDGDLLLYGCNLAASEDGQSLIDSLAKLTRADVAASEDLTGHAGQGGDWVLEYKTGSIETTIITSEALRRDWNITLSAPVFSPTVLDEFSSTAFTNNDGSANWSGDWLESDGAGAGAAAGDIIITGGELSIRGVGNSITREVDLTNASSATLTFDFNTGSGVESADPDSLIMEVSGDGGSTWTVLETFDSFDGINTGSRNYDISAFISDNTQVRFLVANGYGGPDEFFNVDNVRIQYANAISVAENTTAVTTLTATDADLDALTYSISGGTDAALFDIDTNSGVLTFKTAPDFETPTDANTDNVYEVTVQASDGTATDTQAVSVTVNNVAGNVSGVVFMDEGVTNIGAGKTINLLVNGVNVDSAVTGAGGAYSFTSEVSAGDAIAVFIDNDATYKGVTVTVSDGTDLNGVQILADHIVIRNDNGGVTSNTDLANALGGSPDLDIHYAVVGGTLIANGLGEEVLIPAGHTYTPGGDVSASNIKILGTVNGGANTFNIAGDWNSTVGTWNADTSTVNLIGTGVLLQNTSATPWNHGFNNLSVATAGQTTTMSSVVWTNQLTTGTGVLTDAASSHALYLQGTGDVFIDGGGILDFDALHYRVNNASQNVVGRDYTGVSELYFNAVGGLAGSGIYEMQGNVIANDVYIMINNNGDPGYVRNAVLNTNNFNFTASNLHVGVNGQTDEYAVFNAGSSTVDINGDVNIYATDANGSSVINAATSTWTVAGDWINYDTFTAGVSTIVLDGTGMLNSGGNTFYNLTTGAASQVTTLMGDLTVTGVLTIADPTGVLTDNSGGYDITVTGTGTPFVNNGATVTARNFIYRYPTDATITAAGGTYNVTENLYIAGSGTGSGTTYRLNGDLLVTGGIHIYATSFGVSILDTLSHSITTDSLQVSNSSFQVGFLYANNSTIDINGDVDFVNSVTTSVNLGGSNWFVSGNWTNNSNTFVAGSSTVSFDGSSQTISGSTDFYNFTKIESTDDATDSTLIFDNTATQTINGTLTLDGLDTDDRINLISNNPANQWSINLTATAIKGTMDYLDVADSDASGSDVSHKIVNPSDSFNSGNNIDWFSNSVPTIGGTVVGQVVNDNATIGPFSSVVIGDNDVIETLTVTVTLDEVAKGVFSTLNGFTDSGSGVYTFSGTAAAATSAIQGVVFDPTDNRVALGATETTTFTISVDDGVAAPTTDATTTVVSTSINDAPVVGNDNYAVNEGATLNLDLSSNDNDVDDGLDLASIVITSAPANGSIVVNVNGTVDYTHDGSETVSDTFTYTIKDNSGVASNAGTVTITVNPANDTPTMIFPGTVQNVNEDTPLVFSIGNGNQIAVGDVDANGNELLIDFLSYNGSLTLNGTTGLTFITGDGIADTGMQFTGTISDINAALEGLTFTPDAEFSGGTNFQMWVNDQGNTGSGFPLQTTRAALIAVAPVNDAPVAVNDTYNVNEGSGGFLPPMGVLLNDSDIDSGTLTAIQLSNVAHGTLTLNSNGSYWYTPDPDYYGTDSFTYKVNDGSLDSNIATVTLNIAPRNDAPAGSDNTVTIPEDTDYTFSSTDFGFSDPVEGDGLLAVRITTLPGAGTLSLLGSGAVSAGDFISKTDIDANRLIFTPVTDANGTGYASFTFQVQDDGGTTNSGVDLDQAANTMTIDVTPVNDAPVIDTGLTFNFAEDAVNGSFIGGVTANDVDTSGSLQNWQIVSGNSTGMFQISPLTGELSVADNTALDYESNTSHVLGVQVGDGVNTSTVEAITLDVINVNEAPYNSVPATQTTSENTPLVFSSLDGNSITVSDPDGSAFMVEVTFSVSNGTLSLPGTSGLGFSTGSGTGDTAMTFTGSVLDVNAAIDGLMFQPDSGYRGFANLTIITDDLGGSGVGGALNTMETVTISVVETASGPSLVDILPALDELTGDFNEPQATDPVPGVRLPSFVDNNPVENGAEDAFGAGLTDSGLSESQMAFITGSSGGIPAQIEVSAFQSYDWVDSADQQYDRDRTSSSALIQRAVRLALVNPLLAAGTLVPLDPGAPIWGVIDIMMGQMSSDHSSSPDQDQILVKTTKGLTFTLTAGYVSWLLRAGYLSASLMSIAPLWREFDPLPILAKPKKNKSQSDVKAKDRPGPDEITAERVFTTSRQSITGNGTGSATL